VAQGVGPEFKPQYHKNKTTTTKKTLHTKTPEQDTKRQRVDKKKLYFSKTANDIMSLISVTVKEMGL
jgi:hypothetical protein